MMIGYSAAKVVDFMMKGDRDAVKIPSTALNESDSETEIFNLLPKNRKAKNQSININNDEILLGPKCKSFLATVIMLTFVGIIMIGSTTAFWLVNPKSLDASNLNAAADAQWDSKQQRMSDYFIPELYTLTIRTSRDGKVYDGNVKIKLECRQDTNAFVIHSTKHVITRIMLKEDMPAKDAKAKDFKAVRLVNDTENEVSVIHLNSNMEKGKFYEASFDFHGGIGTEGKGLFRIQYESKDGNNEVMIVSNFEASYARRVFPCFDDPGMKAKFDVNIVHGSQQSLSNQPLSKSVFLKNGLVKDHFQRTPKMSVSLIQIVIGDLHNQQTSYIRKIPINVFAPPQFTLQAAFINQLAVSGVAFFEKKFRMKYPLEKLDLVFVPGIPVSVGAWGLITLTTIHNATAQQQYTSANSVLRQISKIWLHSLVTTTSVSEQWLTEGLATVMATECLISIRPEWKPDQIFYQYETNVALERGQFLASKPLFSSTFNNSLDKSQSMPLERYTKASSILKMLMGIVGKKKFTIAVQKYLKRYQYGVEEFIDCVSEVSKPTNIKDIMKSWINQPGYPVVNIQMLSRKRVRISQKRFAIYHSSKSNETWFFPLRFETSNYDHPKKIWLASGKTQMKFRKSFKWLKANYGQKGLYRVNYNEKLWKAIIYQLKKNHSVFREIDRAGILGDSITLASAGQLNFKTAMDVTMYLNKESAYLPWSVAIDNVDFLLRIFSGKKGEKCLKKFFNGLSKRVLKSISWSDKGSFMKRFLTPKLLSFAMLTEDRRTLKIANTIFKKWIKSKARLSIPSDIARFVYRVGVKYGGKKEYNFVYKEFLKSENTTEGNDLLFGLADARSTKTLKGLLDDKLKHRHKAFVLLFKYIGETPIKQGFLWQHFLQNWDRIFKRFGESKELKTITRSALKSSSDTESINKAKDFLKNKDSKLSNLDTQILLEELNLKERFLQKYSSIIRKWLERTLNKKCT